MLQDLRFGLRTLLKTLAICRTVPLDIGKLAGEERHEDAEIVRGVARQRQGAFHCSAPLRYWATHPPKPEACRDQPQREISLGYLLEPVLCRSQVGPLGLQPVEP